MQRAILSISILSLSFLVAGCSSYATPGRAANFSAMGVTTEQQIISADGSIRQTLDKKPLAKFPTGVAVVRVQDTGYRSRTAAGWGTGRYSVVTTRDVEDPRTVESLAKLPMVSGIAPLNRLLLSDELQTDKPLREAAARLHADILLIYTFDTTFVTDDKAAPLTLISLGLSPNRQVRLTTTASAVFVDTRNGYVYGVAEATERQDRLTNAWQNEVAIDETRRATETAAFEKLVRELETTWNAVVKIYARG